MPQRTDGPADSPRTAITYGRAMADTPPDATSSTVERDAVLVALREIADDAATLAEWAEEVLQALASGDDDEAAELGEHVEAVLDYTDRVEKVENWATDVH